MSDYIKHLVAATTLTLTLAALAAPAALADESRRVVIPPELWSIQHPGAVGDLGAVETATHPDLSNVTAGGPVASTAVGPDLSNVTAGGPIASTSVGPDLSNVTAGGPGGIASTAVGPDLSRVIAGGPGGIDSTTLVSGGAGEAGGLDWRALLAGMGAGLGLAALAAALALTMRHRRTIAHP
jgi:hypothetical protein